MVLLIIFMKKGIFIVILNKIIFFCNSTGIRKPVIIDFGKMKKTENVRLYIN